MRWRRIGVVAAATYLGVLALNRSLVRVQGPSMEPRLWPGDLLLTVPAVRWLLRPGQVVVVTDPYDPTHPVVKRVERVADGTVTVLGDDPDRSTDSRLWGPLPLAAVRRVAVARWPDVRTPLRRPVPATGTPASTGGPAVGGASDEPGQSGRRPTSSSSGSSSATSPERRRS